MASAGSIEQTFVSLEDGVQPADAAVGDRARSTSTATSSTERSSTRVSALGTPPWRSAASRAHRDHALPPRSRRRRGGGGCRDRRAGLSGRARLRTVRAGLGELGLAGADRPRGSARHGVPPERRRRPDRPGSRLRPFIRYALDPELLYEGSTARRLAVVELPGHADGHLGLSARRRSHRRRPSAPTDLAGRRALSRQPARSARRLPQPRWSGRSSWRPASSIRDTGSRSRTGRPRA